MPVHPPGARPRPDERGLSESVQWAVLAPLVLLALLGVVHAGILLHGRSVATNAALAGAEAQALSGATAGVGERVAREVAQGNGLREVQVATGTRDGEVWVQVRGRVDSFLAGRPSRVDSTAWMPREAP